MYKEYLKMNIAKKSEPETVDLRADSIALLTCTKIERRLQNFQMKVQRCN